MFQPQAVVKEWYAAILVDVLVIGGGTAGPMAAAKAKEANPQLRVLLLEKANAVVQFQWEWMD